MNLIMKRSQAALLLPAAILLSAIVALVFVAPAGAQTVDGNSTAADFEVLLFALSPLVTLFASLLLRPAASSAVKKAFPAVVGVAASVLYFVATSFPDSAEMLIANILVVVALAQKLYDPIDGFAQVLFKSKLNNLTGPGVVGSAVVVEGD